ALSTINVDIQNPEVPSVFKEIFEVGEKINEEIGKLLQDGIHSGYLKEDLDLLPTIFSLWGGITGIIRVSSQKQLYFMKSMSLTKTEFLDYSFKMFLQSILKEGVPNAY
ncbi:MAG: TetR/AcrR family transcriptional regulator, partial [Candidatus Gastranaerophilaceae bacterium]